MQGQGGAPLTPADHDETLLAPETASVPDRRVAWLLGVVAVVLLVLDAVSKVVVVAALSHRAPLTVLPDVLDLELTRNSGAAFSVGPGATVVFTAVAAGVVVAIVRTSRRLVSRGWAVALGLLLGGALGNLSDRLVRSPGIGRGAVVDWIHLHHWPVFNLADSGIVVGAVLAAVLSARGVPLTPAGPVESEAVESEAVESGPVEDVRP